MFEKIIKIIFIIIKSKYLSKLIVLFALRLHNYSYQIAGTFSSNIEPDGLHPKHRLLKYHDWFIKNIRKEWSVLDVGCGNGALAYNVSKYCSFIQGIDLSKRNIDIAQSRFSDPKLSFVCGDATRYVFKKNYEAIILSNVLEHIEKRIDFIKHLFDNQSEMNPPILLLRVPMIDRDWITLYKKEIGVEWRLDPTHFIEYTNESIHNEIGAAGLVIEKYDVQFGEFYGVCKKKIHE